MDFIFGNLSLTLGGLLIVLFVGYKWGFKSFMNALKRGCDSFNNSFLAVWLKIAVYILCPLGLGGMMLYIIITGKALG